MALFRRAETMRLASVENGWGRKLGRPGRTTAPFQGRPYEASFIHCFCLKRGQLPALHVLAPAVMMTGDLGILGYS